MRESISTLWGCLWARKTIQLLVSIFFLICAFRFWHHIQKILFVDYGYRGGIDLLLLKKHFIGFIQTGGSFIQFPATNFFALPVIYWDSPQVMRVAMAIVLALSIFGLIRVLTQWLQLEKMDQIFLGLYLLSSYPVAITVGNGQWVITVLFLLLWSLWRLDKATTTLLDEYLVLLALLFSLIKPHCAAPFFWLVLFRSRRYKIVFLVSLFYLYITFLMVHGINMDYHLTLESERWQNSARALEEKAVGGNWMSYLGYYGKYVLFLLVIVFSTILIFRYRSLPNWLQRLVVFCGMMAFLSFLYSATHYFVVYGLDFNYEAVRGKFSAWKGAIRGLGVNAGYGNFHHFLGYLGYGRSAVIFSIVSFFMFGGWVFLYRNRPMWLLIGVTGLYARLWTYHRLYEDLLIICPMITLWCIIQRDDGYKTISRIFLMTTAFMLLLASFFLKGKTLAVASWGTFVYWICMSIFLMYYTHKYSVVESAGTHATTDLVTAR